MKNNYGIILALENTTTSDEVIIEEKILVITKEYNCYYIILENQKKNLKIHICGITKTM